MDSFLVREIRYKLAQVRIFIHGEANTKLHDEEPLSPMQVDSFLVREITKDELYGEYLSPAQLDSCLIREIRRYMSEVNAGRFIYGEGDSKLNLEEYLF